MPPTKAPGPAAYNFHPLVGFQDHDVNSQKRRQPQWSMGSKQKFAIENKSPGPSKYNPVQLTRHGKTSSIAQSMAKKNKELKADRNPGPTHNPTDVTLYRWRKDPTYSVGIKTKGLKRDQVPGPDSEPTSVDVYKHRSPKYPMFTKPKELLKDRVPGPNRYDAGVDKMRTMRQYPAYSMGFKPPAFKREKIPGPAHYDLKSHNPFQRGPSFPLGVKHSEYKFVPVLPADNC